MVSGCELVSAIVDNPVGTPTATVQIYPNPAVATDFITLAITTPESSFITISLYDITGRLLKNITERVQIHAGDNRFTFEGMGLQAGMYIVEVKGERIQVQQKLCIGR